MREDVKRMNYYNGLFLKEEEFITEQKYHIRLRRLMNKLLNNIYGVLEGLEVVSITDSKKYRVGSGVALSVIEEGDEELAAEMVLSSDYEVDLSNPDFVGKNVYITISYDAKPEDSVPEKGDNPIHIVERPKVIATLTNADPKKDIVLAVIKLPSDANWKSSNAYIDTSQRREIPVAIRSINGISSTDNGNIDIQEGSNIKITPDLAGNKLTISAGGGSQWSAGQGGAIFYNAGNVGVGTPTPASSLDIVSSGEAFRAGNANSWFKMWTGGNSRLSFGNGSGKEAGFIAGGKNDRGENTLALSGCDDRDNCPTYLILHQSGNVGIGTASPDRSLTVSNVTGANYMNIKDGTHEILMGVDGNGGILSVMTNHDLILRAGSNSEKLRITAAGNVGIGTTNPQVKLAINGSGTNVYATDAWVENNTHIQGNENLAQGGRGRLRIGTAWGFVGLYSENSSTGKTNDLVLGASSGKIRIGPDSGGQRLEVHGPLVTIQSQTIKIGETSPTNRYGNDGIRGEPNLWLDAQNTVYIKPGANVSYGAGTWGDVSERFDVSDVVEAGEVAVMVKKGMPLQPCNSAYDSRVIGIVSKKPAFILGSEEKQKPIALCGVVRCKVDADIAPISVGDLLTTSPTKGHAQKALDAVKSVGSIIGKALESLAGGKGSILVLVTLQ